MKKNGFIATSILYSFFLVFITLFIALVANYLHNKILVNKIDQSALNYLDEVNRTKLSDVNVGEYITFSLKNEKYLNKNGKWVLAYKRVSGDTHTLYFLSDLNTVQPEMKFKLKSDPIEQLHTTTIDVFNEINNANAIAPTIYYSGFKTYIPTFQDFTNIRSQTNDNQILNAIFDAGDRFTMRVPTATGNYAAGYYEVRKYNFNLGPQQTNIVPSYCGGSFNGTSPVYNTGNTAGYIHVVKETNSNTRYVDTCYYAAPSNATYNHLASDNVVSVNEINQTDYITQTISSVYNLRIIAEITVSGTSNNTYIAGGKGLEQDPYIFTNGVMQG